MYGIGNISKAREKENTIISVVNPNPKESESFGRIRIRNRYGSGYVQIFMDF
jgi:hypothetical protein